MIYRQPVLCVVRCHMPLSLHGDTRSLKMILKLFYPVCLFVLFSISSAQEWQYKYYKSLDYLGNYILGWQYNATHIEFQVTVKTDGYVGFGISKQGRMFEADIVMGWILNTQLYLGDYHTNATSRTPMMDMSQDWVVVNGTEYNGTTVLEFVRKLDTCDPNDIPITKDRMNIIWSYAPTDPDVITGMVPHHGFTQRGSTEIFLLESDAIPNNYPPPETYMFPLKNANYTIPATGSNLQCIVVDLSKTVTQQSYIIKFAPDITPGNEAFVYRMVLYRCNINDPNETLNGKVFDCEAEAPLSVKSCKSMVATWSMGGETFHFPKDVGIPMGGPSDPTNYVLEIHYSKFEEVAESVPDSSGLIVTYTNTPVLNPAGMLELGKVISPGWKQVIPDNEDRFTTSSYCSPRCMKWGFGSGRPENDQIQVIGVMFKGNDVAREIRLRHFRGTEELPTISVDKKFSNFYQGPRLLNNPVTVQSTDSLSVECTFNTTSREFVTMGGWSRVNEVCRATLVYYPAKQFDLCLSWSSFDQLTDEQGNKVIEADAFGHLSNITKWSTADKQRFKVALETSHERSICSSVFRQPAFAIDRYKPEITKPYIEPKTCF